MATENINILLDARDRASAKINNVKRSLGGLSGAVSKANKSMLAFGGAFALLGASKGILGLVQASAASKDVEASFVSLADSMGASSDRILLALQQSSRGTIDNTNLMLAANKAMALGLTADADQMSEAMNIAVSASQAFGISTQEAYNRIITGSAKMRNELLDEIGIVVDSQKAYDDFAAKLGVTANELSAAGKQAAFFEAALAAGRTAYSSFSGELSDSQKIATYNTALSNLTDTIGRLATGAVADGLYKAAQGLAAIENAILGLASIQLPGWLLSLMSGNLSIDLGGFQSKFDNLVAGANRLDDRLGEMFPALAGAAERAEGGPLGSLGRLGDKLVEAGEKTKALTDPAAVAAYQMQQAGIAIESVTEDTSKYIKAADDAEVATGNLGASFSSLQGKVSGVLDEIRGDTAGVKADDLLPPGPRLDENARRLADIAIKGFAGQEWLDDFKREVPDVYQALVDSGDPQGAAKNMLKDFQDGFLNGTDALLNKDAIKDKVKRMLLGEQGAAAVAEEIAQEIAAELGISIGAARTATNQVLGGGGGGGGGGTVSTPTICPKMDPIVIDCIPATICADSLSTMITDVQTALSESFAAIPIIPGIPADTLSGIQSVLNTLAEGEGGIEIPVDGGSVADGVVSGVVADMARFQSAGALAATYINQGMNENFGMSHDAIVSKAQDDAETYWVAYLGWLTELGAMGDSGGTGAGPGQSNESGGGAQTGPNADKSSWESITPPTINIKPKVE